MDRGKHKNQKLIDDLVKLNLLNEIPFESWILSCAAVIVPRDCLARILDFVLSDKEDIICKILFRKLNLLNILKLFSFSHLRMDVSGRLRNIRSNFGIRRHRERHRV